ncbi:mu-like prophage FluMu tail sheath protein [Ylistrum balloti]|uniref:mu-like prophage FluMu tail sheath protein n=1 Tax=Ylistrum balloti TaxID=509963 RepID=UPI002905B607|nr:mu-like prophage FluMu tail sheath protein [Ylistrum balloti]
MATFTQIPSNWRVPGGYIEVDGSQATSGATAEIPRAIGILGQKLNDGDAAANTPVRVFSDAEIETKAGRGSMLAKMAKLARRITPETPLFLLPLDDDSNGVQAVYHVTLPASTATESRIARAYIDYHWLGVQKQGVIEFTIDNGDDQDDVIAAFVAAVSADEDLLFAAAVDGSNANVAVLTCRHKGGVGNDLTIKFNLNQGERFAAGIKEPTVSRQTDGSGNPDVSTVLDNLGELWLTDLVAPYRDSSNLTALETFARESWDALVQKEVHLFSAVSGTVGDMTTFGLTRNSEFLSVVGIGKSPSSAYLAAVSLACVDVSEPHPARSLEGLPLEGIVAAATEDQLSDADRNSMLHSGVSSTTVVAGTLRIQKTITTYRVNSVGSPDEAFLDRQTLKTLMAINYASRVHFRTKYPRYLLGESGRNYDPGVPVMTAELATAEWMQLADQFERRGWIETADKFVKEVTRPGANTLDSVIQPDLMNRFEQLRVLNLFKR